MNLHELAPVMGSTHVNKRKGRGSATGNGKTAGRGHKGQKARSGGKLRIRCLWHAASRSAASTTSSRSL